MPKEWYEGWADELDEGGVVLQRSASKPNLEDGPKSANIGDVGGQGYNSADLTASVGAQLPPPPAPLKRVHLRICVYNQTAPMKRNLRPLTYLINMSIDKRVN